MKLLGIGDNVVDYYHDQGMMYPGGNALNVAVIARRNGAEGCAYLGILGDDAAAMHVIACMDEEGIDATRIRRVYGANVQATVVLNPGGERHFAATNRGERVSSQLQLKLNEADFTYIANYDLIHTSVNSDIEHELPRLASLKPVSFDFSTPARWTEEYLKQVCPYLTYAFFSGSELCRQDIQDLTDLTHSLGVKIVGVTRGSEAAQFSEQGVKFEQIPDQVSVLDTMGAGDSFIGAFLAAYHGVGDMVAALGKAAQSAAVTCTYYGAFGYGKAVNR